MSNIAKRIKALIASAQNSHSYKLERAILKFTEQLTLRMKDIGVSPSLLAEKIKVKPPYVSKILRGTSNFTLDSIIKISTALESEFIFDLVPKESSKSWIYSGESGLSIKSISSARTRAEFKPCDANFGPYESVGTIQLTTSRIPNHGKLYT
jgi:transcriptional regulator with XRE-family HTH domain